MPRSFDVSADSPASVAQVHDAFGEEDYWLARLAAFGGERTLDSLVVDADGTVTVVVTQDLRHGALPGILTTFYRGDLNIVSTEVWTPAGDGQVGGQVSVAVTGAPGSGSGTAVLAPLGSGSRLSFAGTVQFRVPLVGGTVESFIAREFAQGIPRIQRFTTA
ncbi:MAG TPA: DUF2505 domain-containing protein, partial [Mycobacterium sp.]|nr:DUF2505 domain-containing protein [Mycobacterium sp.]